MKTLITGANGHVGANLVRALLAQGREVRVLLHRKNDALVDLPVERIYGNILEPDSLIPAFDGITHVHHLAARIAFHGEDPDTMFRINVTGTTNVVHACLQAEIKRLVHFSSVHALSYHPITDPIDEYRGLALDHTHLAYDQSKALAEVEVLKGIEKGLDAVILNPVGIIGPYDFEPSPIGELLLQLAHREMPGLVQSGFYWVDVRDVVDAAIEAETRGSTGERYILHGEYGPVAILAESVRTHTGSRPPLFNAPMWLAKRVAIFIELWAQWSGSRPLFTRESMQILACHQHIDTRKAQEALGFKPRPLDQTLRDTLAWFADHGSLRVPLLTHRK